MYVYALVNGTKQMIKKKKIILWIWSLTCNVETSEWSVEELWDLFWHLKLSVIFLRSRPISHRSRTRRRLRFRLWRLCYDHVRICIGLVWHGGWGRFVGLWSGFVGGGFGRRGLGGGVGGHVADQDHERQQAVQVVELADLQLVNQRLKHHNYKWSNNVKCVYIALLLEQFVILQFCNFVIL